MVHGASLQTEDEMAEMEGEIRGLDADLQAKTASLKLAHTRLEIRTRRPGMDLCRDQVCGALWSVGWGGGTETVNVGLPVWVSGTTRPRG